MHGFAGKKIVYATTIGVSAWSYFDGHLSYMSAKGAEVHLVSSPDEYLVKCGRREGVSTHAIPMAREISLFRDLISLYYWVRLLVRIRPDIVNVGTPKAALLGLIAARLLLVPKRVYTVRGLRFETATPPLRRVLVLIEKLCCILATDVVAVGVGVAAELRSNHICSKPVLVIGSGSSNGVKANSISERVRALDARSCRSRWGLAQDSFVIGFVGRVTADKGCDVLAAGLSELANLTSLPFELLVVGEVEDQESSEIFSEIPVRCRSTGWLEDTSAAYRAMNVLCLPSRREGYPNVVLEAGSAGIPVVTTDATGAFESVVDGETGIVFRVDDSSALARALLTLVVDAFLCVKLGTAGRSRAEEHFRPERIWDGLIEIYLGGFLSDHSSF